jgi:hypothetical protein
MVMHQSWAAGFVYRAFRVTFSKAPPIPASKEALR